MKKECKLLFVFGLTIMLSLPTANGLFAQEQEAHPLVGTWDVELTEMGMAMQFVFKMEDEVLSGTLEFEMGSGILEEISFEENTLTFFVSIDAGGQTMGVDVEGTIEDDQMTGVMYTEMGDANFTGTKREE